jgi:hypothetical protein
VSQFWGALHEHDPEKWKPVFGQDHAQTKIAQQSIQNESAPDHPGRSDYATDLTLLI